MPYSLAKADTTAFLFHGEGSAIFVLLTALPKDCLLWYGVEELGDSGVETGVEFRFKSLRFWRLLLFLSATFLRYSIFALLKLIIFFLPLHSFLPPLYSFLVLASFIRHVFGTLQFVFLFFIISIC